MKFPKITAAALTLSAAGFVGILQSEGFSLQAIIPTKGDVPTVGFGMTKNPDGSSVKMGDKTTPVKAVKRSLDYITEAEADFKECINVPLSQAEYDVYIDFGYQFGVPALCRSTIIKKLNEGDYMGACNALLLYKRVGSTDCSTPGNKICGGVWRRQQARHAKCVQAQEGQGDGDV